VGWSSGTCGLERRVKQPTIIPDKIISLGLAHFCLPNQVAEIIYVHIRGNRK
jgi:hypothetical protein